MEEEDNDDDNKACRAQEIEVVTSSRSGRNIASLVCNVSFCPVAVGESGLVRPVVTANTICANVKMTMIRMKRKKEGTTVGNDITSMAVRLFYFGDKWIADSRIL